VRKLGKSDPARQVGSKTQEAVLGGILVAIPLGVAAGGKATRDKFRSLLESHRNKKLAIALARQTQGQYSENTVIDGVPRFVVWKDGVPKAAFPKVNGAENLAERDELKDFPRRLLKGPDS
jgi:hypothetical protein